MRKWLVMAAVIVVAFATMAAQCNVPVVDDWGARVTEVVNLSPHPGSVPRYDSQMFPGLGSQYDPTLCFHVHSQVSNRTDYCRVVNGYEGTGDNHDWIVNITLNGGTPVLPGPVSAYDGKFWTITLENGQTFENCWKDTAVSQPGPGLPMLCDYEARGQFIATDSPSNGIFMGNILDELWHWNKYEVGQDENCAGAIALLWSAPLTGVVTWKLLTDCSDKPYDGSGLP